MRAISLIAVIVMGILLLVAVRDFPNWADPNSPASVHVSPHYITMTLEETSVPNVVTSVLADYRGFDTMFETAVIFTAGIAVIIILRQFRRRREEDDDVPADVVYQDKVVQTVCRQMVPFVQLFALYVVAHGHHSPGGGFQGGVILGASFILLAISYDLKMALGQISERTTVILGNAGVFIFAGIGFISIMLGANFLDYSILNVLLPGTDSVQARSHGMLGIEIGVALAVMAIMVIIYANIASRGRFDKGL